MTTDFMDLNLHPQLVQAVIELGYLDATPIQAEVIPLMLAGRDVIGQAQTGTGKTAAFALPILHNLQPGSNTIQALILVPTRELAIQVSDVIESYGKYRGARVLSVYGGAPYGPQLGGLRRGVDVVVGTPGRLIDLLSRDALNLNSVKTVVLDEADEMLSMGFVEDIQTLLDATPTERQTALFSATLPPAIRHLADSYLHDPQSISIQREHVAVGAIEQRYLLVNAADKQAALTRLFEVEPITSALIFARTRVGSSELAAELNMRGYPVEVLNGDLAQDARERVIARFRSNQIKVLVATDVAARGLDIEDISHVFNYDLPDDVEIYVHRIGRTGRAGKTGIAITLATPSEQWRLRRIEAFMKQRIQRVALPTEEEIYRHREEEILGRMKTWLQRARYKQERTWVERLIEEGHDPIDIAAAALKMSRAEEKQRPIAPISEVNESRPRLPGRDQGDLRRGDMRRGGGDSRERSRAPQEVSTTSHEQGMVRLTISRGRVHGVRPSDVVSTIAYHAEIPGNTIGRIHIQDKLTFVDVPESLVQQVLAKTSKYRLNRQPITVEVA
jgi:ATP-dependent RNA helicase DeaD